MLDGYSNFSPRTGRPGDAKNRAVRVPHPAKSDRVLVFADLFVRRRRGPPECCGATDRGA